MKFRFYTPVVLIKSGDAPGEPIKIGGRISTESRDADGEKLLTEGLDLSYFNKGYGKIKYEHDNPISKEPDNIIGFPTKIVKGRNYVDFEGAMIDFQGIPDEQLTPQQKAAKGAYGLIKSVEEHNRRNPSIKQNVGWSIEGEYIERDPATGVVKKARITGVVLTTKPKNTDTFAKLIKSMEVGYETDSAQKTGYGAITKESIEKRIKTKEKSSMNEKEFYQSCLDKGMTEEEAKKATEEWKAKQAGETGEAEKGSKTGMKKSEETEEELDKESEEARSELEEVEKSLSTLIRSAAKIDVASTKNALQKSIEIAGNEKDPDILEVFEKQNEATATVLEFVGIVNEKVDVLAKSVATLCKGLNVAIGSTKKVRKGVVLSNTAAAKLLKSAGHSGTLSTDLLKGVQFEDNDPATSASEPTYAEKKKAISALYEEGKLSKSAVLSFENARVMDAQTARLVKSKVNEFRS